MKQDTVLGRAAFSVVACAVLVVTSALPALAAPSLTMPVDYPVGQQPWNVVVALLDGDSYLDLAVVNRGDDSVTVLYGDGNGGFGGVVQYDVGSDPWSVAAADFDGDTYVDLAVANHGDNTVSILPGGAGGFGSAVHHPLGVGGTPAALVAADFNGDGAPDLAIADTAGNHIAILLGVGDRSFADPVYYGVSTYPVWLTSGDFDGDGHLDLAVACTNGNVVSILIGLGDGTFEAKVDYAAGESPVAVAAGDFDGDSSLDLAVANASDDTVSILLGTGDGTFAEGTAIVMDTGAVPAGVVVGEFDGDAVLDLAVANHGSESVSILAGDGVGAFESIGDFAVGSHPVSLGTGDFDSDGRSDVVVVNSDDDSISVMLSRELDELTIQLSAGWNMVSVPLTLPDMSVGAVFPTAVAVYTWNPQQKSYTSPVTIDTRRGYWVAVVGPTTLNLRGVGQSAWEPALDIFAGWNMIGSVYGAPVDFSDPDDDPDGAVLSLLYRWDPGNKSYVNANAIEAGQGYWSAAVSNCTLAAGTQNPE